MIDLLKIEFAKVKNYRVFWIIMAIYALLVPLGFYGLCRLINEILGNFGLDQDYTSFPNLWKYITWTSAWWNMLLGILVVILTCNEISFRTQRQNVIDGMSRKQVIGSKFLFLIALALVVTVYTGIVGFIYGVSASGMSGFTTEIHYLGIYFLQTLGYFSVAYLFAVIFKKSALAIIFFIIIWILNLFIGQLMPNGTADYIPTYLISGLNPSPFFSFFVEMEQSQGMEDADVPIQMGLNMKLILGSFYILGFVALGYVFVRNRDL
jgi:ABC-2 type transport system permease protein